MALKFPHNRKSWLEKSGNFDWVMGLLNHIKSIVPTCCSSNHPQRLRNIFPSLKCVNCELLESHCDSTTMHGEQTEEFLMQCKFASNLCLNGYHSGYNYVAALPLSSTSPYTCP
ncbi:hypothetical protein AVEN_3954-1 [Araneus ventricosus]|uniref:Uncharacterized protein n=1 Tax=Araneus ventricosus TaxID=182803 RepID=A0A4Y2SKN5_ARAVE|nr:hypothetical protein AVEN_3954-1 [Araneus ventricosus]